MKSKVLGIELKPGEVEILEMDDATANSGSVCGFSMVDFRQGHNSLAFHRLCSDDPFSFQKLNGICRIRIVNESEMPERRRVWFREHHGKLLPWRARYGSRDLDWDSPT